MALYTSENVLGAQFISFADALDAYIERTSSVGVGNSDTDLGDLGSQGSYSASATNRFAQMTTNTASLTGTNCTYFCTNLFNGGTANSSPVNFTNSSIHLGHDEAAPNNEIIDWWFPTNFNNVNIYNEATGSLTVGIYGNGSGTNFPTFDANGHITTNGDGHKARARTWIWNNVNIYGNGGLQFLMNGVVPATSSFSNVSFNPAPGRGAFGELPFVSFADATWGQFYRPDFPLVGDSLWARLTGGMNRSDLNVLTNWMIQPQWDVTALDGQTAQVAVDGRCFVYFVNMVLPADASNLTLRGGQGTQAAVTGQNGPTRIISCYGWNPLINGGTNDIKYGFDGFNIQTVPATFTGGNTDGTSVLPADFASGSVEPAGFNGFFIVQSDTGSLTANTIAAGDTVEQYTPRDIQIFSYDTQLNTIDGTTFNQNFGRTVTATPNEHLINADLTWRSSTIIDEPVDPFLNGIALTTDFSTTLTSLDEIYPTLKSVAYAQGRSDNNRFRIVPSEGGLRFLEGVDFETTFDNRISTLSGSFFVDLQQTNIGVNFVNTLMFVDENNNSQNINWSAVDGQGRTFAGAITIIGGTHQYFPEDWTNGLTLGGAITINRATQSATLDWTNVNIPDGATVNFTGTTALSIAGLTAAEQGRVSGDNINFPVVPVTNRIVIPTPAAGRYAIRQTVGDVNTEIVPPADFSAGDTITHTINDTVFTNPADTVQVYVKYDSTIGVGGTVYSESEQVFIFNSDGSDINYIPQIVAPVLVDTATPLVGHNIAARADGNNVIVSIANTLNNNRLELDANETLGALISAANTNAYWDAWYANRVMSATPLFDYVQGFRTSVDARFVTLASGNRIGADGFVQHQIANTVRNAASVGDTLIEAGTGIPELTVQLSDLAIVDPGLIASAVDASNTASSVEDIVNYEGYRSQNPLLNGPNGGAINNATDYRNNIRRT